MARRCVNNTYNSGIRHKIHAVHIYIRVHTLIAHTVIIIIRRQPDRNRIVHRRPCPWLHRTRIRIYHTHVVHVNVPIWTRATASAQTTSYYNTLQCRYTTEINRRADYRRAVAVNNLHSVTRGLRECINVIICILVLCIRTSIAV